MTPTVRDFYPGEKYLIRFLDDGPDEFGRRRFFLYWRARTVGPRPDQFGVRGQAYYGDPSRFNAREIG